MIEAVNFFQSLGFFGSFSNIKVSDAERKLSRDLIKDAKKLMKDAENEARNGENVETLTLNADETNLKQNLAQIAIWHHKVSAKSYRLAAARYDEAGRIRADKQKVLQRHAEEVIRLAEKSEKAVRFLNKFTN